MFAKRKRLSYLLSITFTVLFVLTGCANTAAGTTTSGLKFSPNTGVDANAKTITLGILTPLTGPVAGPIGIPLTRGVTTFFDGVNGRGGIDGYKIKFIQKDSKYDVQTQVTDYQQIHNQVLMIAESLGTANTQALTTAAGQDQMLLSGATLASSLAREKYVVMVGTPYRLQVENAFDYVVNKLGVSNPATGIIYQNDDYGQDGLTGYQEAIAAYHLNDVAQASYAPTDKEFTAQVAQMKAKGAKYVFLTTIPSVTATILVTAAKLGYNPQWILQSPAYATVLLGVPALVPLLSKCWLVGQGALWGDTSKPGMVQLLKDVQQYASDQKPDGYFEFGYLESYVTYAILKKALDNNDVTRAGLFKAFESLNNVDLGGLYPAVTYGSSPDQRVPTRDSTIFAIDPTAATTGFVTVLQADFTGTAATQSHF